MIRQLVVRTSLSSTVDRVNEAFFKGDTLSKRRRTEAAKWIADRQGLPGSYTGALPAPTPKDIVEGIRFFTGERLHTRAGVAHVLGEEACRTLILLDVSLSSVRDALNRASEGMSLRLLEALRSKRWKDDPGHYCCGKCTVAVWRHLTVGGMPGAQPEQWLSSGMRRLRRLRTQDGKWRTFPFYYTLLALTEIDLPSAVREIKYAAPVCERVLRCSPRNDIFAQRRREVIRRALACCQG